MACFQACEHYSYLVTASCRLGWIVVADFLFPVAAFDVIHTGCTTHGLAYIRGDAIVAAAVIWVFVVLVVGRHVGLHHTVDQQRLALPAMRNAGMTGLTGVSLLADVVGMQVFLVASIVVVTEARHLPVVEATGLEHSIVMTLEAERITGHGIGSAVPWATQDRPFRGAMRCLIIWIIGIVMALAALQDAVRHQAVEQVTRIIHGCRIAARSHLEIIPRRTGIGGNSVT